MKGYCLMNILTPEIYSCSDGYKRSKNKCINEDNSFQLTNTYDVGTKVYGINPPYYSSINISAFYRYNIALLKITI